MKARAFTLVEVLVSVAIAGVIIAGATGAVMNIDRLMNDTNRRSRVVAEAMRLEEFMIARLQGAGGGSLRPFTSVLLEDGQSATAPYICRTITGMPACANTDRLTVVIQDTSLPVCTVSGTSGANLNVDDDDASGHCCLDAPLPTAFENKQALLVGPNGVASVFLFNRHGPCAINAPPGQGAGLLPTALAAVGFPATLVAATARTTYVNPAANVHSMFDWIDVNGDGALTTNEVSLIDDQVYDMQVALGFDALPEDGAVDDTASGSDEFLFNATTGEARAPGLDNFATVTADKLRMAQVGIVVGTPSTLRGGNTVKLLNGINRTQANTYLTTTTSKAFLRNLALFTQ